MTPFMNGFCDEVCSSMTKVAALDATPGLLKKLDRLGLSHLKAPAKRMALGSLGVGAFHKMVNPEATLGQALGSGLTLTVGGMAGEQIARNLRMGSKGQTALSILGSILAMRQLRNRDRTQ